jgi:uncharacterized protein YecT (DUF1311 family)
MRFVQILCAALTVTSRALVAQGTHQCAGVTAERPANVCFESVAESLDTRLDSLLAELRRAMPSPVFARLQRGHSLWRASRDSTCAWERDLFAGGSIAPRVEAQCDIALTTERIRTLQIFLCPGAPVMGECVESRRYDVLPEP